MAIVTRYFGVTGAGAADGTTWADRAALFTGGAWSTVITGFSFAGSDSLVCRVGPGTHTVTVAMASGLFASPPTAPNAVVFHGCDSSGNLLTIPDPDWCSARGAWDDSGLPIIATTTNVATSSLALALWRLIKFSASGRNGSMLSAGTLDWCSVADSTNNSAAIGTGGPSLSNCMVSMTGASYEAAVSIGSQTAVNCLLIGVAGSSGNRYGLRNSGSTTAFWCAEKTTIRGFGGHGVAHTSATATHASGLRSCTIVGNAGSGILLPATASQSNQYSVQNCLLAGNGAYGVDAQSEANAFLTNNRYRDNVSGATAGTDNYPEFSAYTTDSDDATEFVNAAGGDYRIANDAATWGMGFGAGDEPAAAGGGVIGGPNMRGGMAA